MEAKPQISVVLTTYNRAHQIGRTVESILAQSLGDFELVISDDCSTDGTEQVCRHFAALDRRIRYVRNDTNLNMPGNLNSAVRRGSAPFVANLHDGDVYRADLLARWKGALDAQRDAAFVFNAWDLLDEEGKKIGSYDAGFGKRVERGELVDFMLGPFRRGGPRRPRPPEAGVKTWAQRATYWFLGPFGCPVWGTVMGRRALYNEAGMFDSRFGFISDVAMWLRLNSKYPAAYVPEPLFAVAPRGLDRAHSSVNWNLEQVLMSILREAAASWSELDGASQSAFRSGLSRARTKRWLFLVLWALKSGKRDAVMKGLELFRQDESVALRVVGWLGSLRARSAAARPAD